MNIGMIVAMADELEPFLAACGKAAGTDTLKGYEVRKFEIGENRIYVVGSGAGEIAAASATQMLISRYDVETIVNFGVVGGLTPEMAISDPVVIRRVVHYDYDASPFYRELSPGQYPGETEKYIYTDEKLLNLALSACPELRAVSCASADKFVAGEEAKSALHTQFGADICEMEAAGILLTCKRCDVPALFIKAVSDGVTGGADEFEEMIGRASEVCVKVVLKVIENVK